MIDALVDKHCKIFLNEIKNKILYLFGRMEVDRAVFFSLLTRSWNLIAGPVTILLIAKHFSPELQGYYYTFASLLYFQFLMELGLGSVIVRFASHEWAGLALDEKGRIIGDYNKLSRLQSLAQFASKWYGVVSFLLTIALLVGGYLFFSRTPTPNIKWMLPWFSLSILTGAIFFLTPALALIEGCNQVAKLYKYRFLQGLCSSFSVWLAIFLGAELWIAAIAALATLICTMIFLMFGYGLFMRILLFTPPSGDKIGWSTEILPLQWRATIIFAVGPLSSALFVPVLFHYHGSVIAGQMGMTLSLLGALSAIASSWIYPKVPLFGMLIAQRRYVQLDQLFWRITKIVAFVTLSGAVAIFIILYVLNSMNHPLSKRFLPLLPSVLFLLSQAFVTMSLPMSSYLRAHKKEPLLVLVVSYGVLLGVSTLIIGKYYSAIGIGVGYLLGNMVFVPLIAVIWRRFRMEWKLV